GEADPKHTVGAERYETRAGEEGSRDQRATWTANQENNVSPDLCRRLGQCDGQDPWSAPVAASDGSVNRQGTLGRRLIVRSMRRQVRSVGSRCGDDLDRGAYSPQGAVFVRF